MQLMDVWKVICNIYVFYIWFKCKNLVILNHQGLLWVSLWKSTGWHTYFSWTWGEWQFNLLSLIIPLTLWNSSSHWIIEVLVMVVCQSRRFLESNSEFSSCCVAMTKIHARSLTVSFIDWCTECVFALGRLFPSASKN